jgi:16S rRNA processing protein RimM
VRGDVRVTPLTDFRRRFRPGSRLYLGEGAHVVTASRRARGELLVHFEGVDSPEEAAKLRDLLLEIPEAEATALPPDTYYRWQLEGLQVATDAGRDLGTVVDVLETGAHDVLVVREASGREHLVPFTEAFTAVDLPARRITVTPIPGLLED